MAHRHVYGHLSLGNGVHRATHERGLEDDVAGDFALGYNLLGREVNLAWEHEEVVVGETAVDAGVHELLNGKAVCMLIVAEVLESGGGVEVGLRRHDCRGRTREFWEDWWWWLGVKLQKVQLERGDNFLQRRRQSSSL